MGKSYEPGQIVVYDAPSLGIANDFPLWGIVLPKKPFLHLFKEEKGEWPSNMEVDEEDRFFFIDKYGPNLPVQVGKRIKDLHLASEEKGRILPPGYFVEDDNLIGVKFFGDIYSSGCKREMSLEIISTIFYIKHQFDISQLSLINKVREITLNELRVNPIHFKKVMFDMGVVANYFAGRYVRVKMEETRADVTKLVRILRECGFSSLELAATSGNNYLHN